MTGLWTAPDAPAALSDAGHRAALRALLLSMADDDLILGHRHSEWTGFAPDIESDVALSSIAQDEIGHARLLYEQAGALDGTPPDRLAYARGVGEYTNAVLLERENGDWAYTIMRAWLYDQADAVRLAALAASRLGSFAALARTVQREEKYHVMFSEAWLQRLCQAGSDSRGRMQEALDAAWAEALGVFEPAAGAERLAAGGILPVGPAELAAPWMANVVPRLEGLGLRVPAARAAEAGREGRHSPALAALLEEMTSVWRSDPEARW